ncbi:hypothetical protein F0562_011682 [Nyssa sinensis]|uniref:Uncharacterized protein n=1 Tax=Nyssa sinensis TaxID=561372 RepID=A0A5J4ZRH1_9ASTE|nr:hypothetical protein F0562_011682 [Nyssa sinensis]
MMIYIHTLNRRCETAAGNHVGFYRLCGGLAVKRLSLSWVIMWIFVSLGFLFGAFVEISCGSYPGKGLLDSYYIDSDALLHEVDDSLFEVMKGVMIITLGEDSLWGIVFVSNFLVVCSLL